MPAKPRFRFPRATSLAGFRRGNTLVASQLNNAISELINAPSGLEMCRVYLASGASMTGGSYADIAWDAESVDAGDWHSLSANTARITVPSAGVYRVSWVVTWAAQTTPPHYYRIQKGGTTVYTHGSGDLSASQISSQPYSITVVCAASDYLTLQVKPGVTVSTVAGENSTWFCVELIGDV